jgi:hypothetical protein
LGNHLQISDAISRSRVFLQVWENDYQRKEKTNKPSGNYIDSRQMLLLHASLRDGLTHNYGMVLWWPLFGLSREAGKLIFECNRLSWEMGTSIWGMLCKPPGRKKEKNISDWGRKRNSESMRS